MPSTIPTLNQLKSELIREQVQLEENPGKNKKRLEYIYSKIRRCNSTIRKIISDITK